MTTVWTDLNKPSVTGWTDLTKPSGSTSVIAFSYSGGEPIGLLLALTQSSVIGSTSIVTYKWSSVASHLTAWVDVPKAT